VRTLPATKNILCEAQHVYQNASCKSSTPKKTLAKHRFLFLITLKARKLFNPLQAQNEFSAFIDAQRSNDCATKDY
jgi:hypothetical protein